MACAAKGLKMIATMPERMSAEKADTLTVLGAELHRTPDAASFTDERSHIGLAHKLCREIENSVFLDQYSNASNPLAHYDQTAEEIFD
mmetsp:Transcript_11731/g.1744  ORF Transcript_11731/g.1744 Transcript_11731/m.1744 type:complete len:88 (+) Transcript_11731:351-614(+)|eukprot:CAMPEP_0168316860 /NCGR_PEP_ID=MMETSP0210-20121227/19946_1 /TAXON_ID=40633 /ORGANISM="Condylostoma magnum, Strain COL2" /LENGTH=87 /DNA_ID=CAMNT_0008306005 /DNA_START=454 /DNA_END=717 /DNA_ORIENTATION=-